MSALRKFSEKEPTEVMPGFKGRFEHGENVTMAFWEIDEGAELPEHSPPSRTSSHSL